MSTLSQKIGYGFGDFSSSMFWKIFTYYLPIFYTNVYGLRLEDAALLMLITKLWDAVSDPMMGILSDRTKSRWGRYRPYLLWIAVPFAVAGILLFTTPDTAYTGKVIWAYATYILMMTVYTAINVPYGAMLGVVTNDPKQRTVFSAFRMFFAYAGSFVALAIFEPMRDYFGDVTGAVNPQSDPSSWQFAMIVVAVLCLIFFVLTFAMTRENVKIKEVKTQKSSIKGDIKALGRNKPWWILLGATICILIFNSIRGGVAAYFFADYVGNSGGIMGDIFGYSLVLSCAIFLAVGEIANMIGVVIAVPLSKAIGKKGAYMAAITFCGAMTLIFWFFGGTGMIDYWGMLILQILISIGAGVTLPLIWSMFADAADYSELQNGKSSVGLIFSSSSMAQKFGGALGTYLILFLLAIYGYQTPENGVQITQSPETLTGLMALMSWIPALACGAGVAVMSLYPLSQKKMDDVNDQLTVIRSKSE
ncbi:MAG: MFS transporter [Rikenellaceae bacterium]